MGIPLRTRRRIAAAATGMLLLAGLAPAAAAGPSSVPLAPADDLFPAVEAPTKAGTYIVQIAGDPVVAYDGGVKGLKATKPAKGEKINPRGRDVVRYVAHLQGKQDAALKAAGGGKKLYSYTYTFNGFAAELSAAAAAKLADAEGVVAVTPDEIRQLDTSSTPDFLGLTDADGLWADLGWPAKAGKKTDGAGEDVIIGIVDSGIWPEHPSLSDRDARGKLVYQQIPGWHGKCTPGEDFNASLCNQKLIGAQYYNAGYGGNAGIDAMFDYEFNSARDADGHGTHTATTAGGNYDVATAGEVSFFGKSISGIAPRARIAAYKVCWGAGTDLQAGCRTTDSVAAIDQAVADGVDVINYSISGTSTNFADPVELAFLFAADAGVFVAASAGNAGPTTSTVAHPSPWITTVAAGTHNRTGKATVTLDDDSEYIGASATEAVGPATLVDAADAAIVPMDADEDEETAAVLAAELCAPGSLDQNVVEGNIVLCKRGVHALVDKSAEVAAKGGVGVVLYNDTAEDAATNMLALFHSVPTVHVVAEDGLKIKMYIAETEDPTASLSDASRTLDEPAPYTASFSSRGPLLGAGGDLLKPDVIAPGQDILAGVSPAGYNGRLFDLLSGTSMSSPHVAGLAALLIDKHPDWSPMAVKSALMTTGYDVLDQDVDEELTTAELIFRQGAGHVQPNKAADPGLVFDSGWNDWLAFLCGNSEAVGPSTCETLTNRGYSSDASDFNSASIAIGDLAGSQTVARTVTNVSDKAEDYTVSWTGLDGIQVNVESFTVPKNGSETIEFTFTTDGAELNDYVGGQITMAGSNGSTVRIPVVVKPVALAAPSYVSSNGDPISYDVTFGYSGDFTATARGLVAAETTPDTVTHDPDQTFDPTDLTGTKKYEVVIPAGTTHQRYAIFEEDVDVDADLDLFVYLGGSLVGYSAAGGSTEIVDFTLGSGISVNLPLTVYVHGWGIPDGETDFVLYDWSVPATDEGNMKVAAPTTAQLGESGTIELSFDGLASATRYLGSVAYSGTIGMPNPTIVEVMIPEEEAATP